MDFRIDATHQRLYDEHGRCYDPIGRTWNKVADAAGDVVCDIAAATWVQKSSGHPWRSPVAVIGPRAATSVALEVAEAVGAGLAQMGFAMLCGGREGVMTAAARGARGAGGRTVGLLPDTDPALANPYIDIVIATGIGEARNALIARAALCLVAIGDSYGTLSEVALARHFGKLVVGLEGAATVEGVRHVEDVSAAMSLVAQTCTRPAPGRPLSGSPAAPRTIDCADGTSTPGRLQRAAPSKLQTAVVTALHRVCPRPRG